MVIRKNLKKHGSSKLINKERGVLHQFQAKEKREGQFVWTRLYIFLKEIFKTSHPKSFDIGRTPNPRHDYNKRYQKAIPHA